MTVKQALADEIVAARYRVMELEQEYAMMLYFEQMPKYDPYYKYCYQTLCNTIPYPMQSVDAWIRAVILHMKLRKVGHGGGATKAVVVSVPELQTQAGIDEWIAYTSKQLRKKVRAKKIVDTV